MKDIEELGYKSAVVLKMVKARPHILAYDIQTIKKKMNDMIDLGHSKKDVLTMTSSYSKLYSLDVENMKQRIVDIMELGFPREQVLTMLKKLPTLYGLSMDMIREKKTFYDMLGISEIMVKKTSCMIQGVELCYARYMFYKSIGIEIDITNYSLLFMPQVTFYKKYGIEKKELREKFNYYRDMGKVKKEANKGKVRGKLKIAE